MADGTRPIDERAARAIRSLPSALTSNAIKAKAKELGFDACGIAPAANHPELTFYREWLETGYAGEMAYLHRTAQQRADVRHVMRSAQTVISTATIYNTNRPYSTECADPQVAQIARYAWGDDYHDVIGGRLETLLAWMRASSPEPFEARAYVDTGPVQERVYAQHAGLGWIGKNTCVISPQLGSWIFLAEIVCSLPLEVDAPALDQCGTCTLCLDACPTHALVAPGVLDSTRCISYLTIELRGDIPRTQRTGVGSHVYGCDVCQEVCPWNAVAPRSADPAWQPRSAWDGVDLLTLARREDAELAAGLKGSAMRRAKVQGLRRNIAVAVANAATIGVRPVSDPVPDTVSDTVPDTVPDTVSDAVPDTVSDAPSTAAPSTAPTSSAFQMGAAGSSSTRRWRRWSSPQSIRHRSSSAGRRDATGGADALHDRLAEGRPRAHLRD